MLVKLAKITALKIWAHFPDSKPTQADISPDLVIEYKLFSDGVRSSHLKRVVTDQEEKISS